MKERYTAIIADIVGSRTLKERQTVQMKLKQVLDAVNTYAFKNSCTFPHLQTTVGIVSPFMITLGDEFQGLVADASLVLPITEYIERHLYPIRIRFGIGIGEITTNISSESPFGMDGPAYHQARDMLIALKQGEHRNREPFSTKRIGIQDNEKIALLVNTTLSLLSTLTDEWTENQQKTISTYLEDGQCNQQRTAKILGITQPTVQKSLASAHIYTYISAIRTLSKILEEMEASA